MLNTIADWQLSGTSLGAGNCPQRSIVEARYLPIMPLSRRSFLKTTGAAVATAAILRVTIGSKTEEETETDTIAWSHEKAKVTRRHEQGTSAYHQQAWKAPIHRA